MGKTTRVGKSLIQIQQELGTEEQCLSFLEALRWPEGVTCLSCGSKSISKYIAVGRAKRDKQGVLTGERGPDRHLYNCHDCNEQFTAKCGTIFNDSHLPLRTWMLAVAVMCNAKKGVSAKQLQRDLGVSYKTAWYLSHRIREAMMTGNWTDEKMTGTVEADETYIGGKYDKRLKRTRWDKPAVFGIRERETGRVFARHMPILSSKNIMGAIRETVSPDAKAIYTDESRYYGTAAGVVKNHRHDVVIHDDKEWVRGDVHTQSIDGFWGLLKRGVIGTYHQVSIKHLDRYVQEFSYRFNNRQNQELFTITVACLALGIPLPYAALVGAKETRIVHNPAGLNQYPATPAASDDQDSDLPF